MSRRDPPPIVAPAAETPGQITDVAFWCRQKHEKGATFSKPWGDYRVVSTEACEGGWLLICDCVASYATADGKRLP